MRDFIDIVENALPAIQLYHGTHEPIAESTFRPLTHFGSLKAALSRSRRIYGDCYIYEVKLRASSPLQISDGKNWNHNPYKLTDILFYTRKIITAEERSYIFGNNGAEITNRIISVLLDKGYDSLRYKNFHEDPGHQSWVNLTSDQVDIIGDPLILTMPECYELEQTL